MKNFMGKNFLLETKTAKTLYHDYAKKMPIIDYHCHINPQEIAENRQFDNITQVWLGGDHYKWRMIRANGVPEEEITGAASDRVKFQRFAEALPKAVGNPLYHWTYLELKRYFGYNGVLDGGTAEEVWNICNEKLKTLTVREIIDQSNVKTIITTDDPIDELKWHKKIRDDKTCTVEVLPAWRPDKAMNIEKDEFCDYINSLADSAQIKISTITDLCTALSRRLDYFTAMGCSASDHGIDYVMYSPEKPEKVNEIFMLKINGGALSHAQVDAYKYAVLTFLGREYAKRNFVMQLHYGVYRNTNLTQFKSLGADTGFDCISGKGDAFGLVGFLNELYSTGELPKTIIYSLNPNDNTLIDTVVGGFQGTGASGKIQHGAAWWFNDTKSGMIDQLKSYANLAVLGNFLGMLTDSRSFLSYTRHEYFRRILCDLIGNWAENGEINAVVPELGKMIEDISYNNTKKYFNL